MKQNEGTNHETTVGQTRPDRVYLSITACVFCQTLGTFTQKIIDGCRKFEPEHPPRTKAMSDPTSAEHPVPGTTLQLAALRITCINRRSGRPGGFWKAEVLGNEPNLAAMINSELEPHVGFSLKIRISGAMTRPHVATQRLRVWRFGITNRKPEPK